MDCCIYLLERPDLLPGPVAQSKIISVLLMCVGKDRDNGQWVGVVAIHGCGHKTICIYLFLTILLHFAGSFVALDLGGAAILFQVACLGFCLPSVTFTVFFAPPPKITAVVSTENCQPWFKEALPSETGWVQLSFTHLLLLTWLKVWTLIKRALTNTQHGQFFFHARPPS